MVNVYFLNFIAADEMQFVIQNIIFFMKKIVLEALLVSTTHHENMPL